ncbi:MAG: hypothetical protein LUQ50_09055, partial [Methanospirillum sp.]|uniref:hypothetical protein n=1 Tax=Methanospirillum sp. TaxID=45200 RepID=UPI00236BF8D4
IQIFGPDSCTTLLDSEKITYYNGEILYQYDTRDLKEGNYYISFTMQSGGRNRVSFHIDEIEQ